MANQRLMHLTGRIKVRTRKQKHKITMGLASGLTLGAALSVGAGAAVVTAANAAKNHPASMMESVTPETRDAIHAASHLSTAFRAVAEHVLPAVVALGQPFGLESTVTAGIISAKHRGIGITPRENFLQTDAAINPGNSGGPLVNLEGEVIGINTAISSRGGGNDGIGFSVPSNLARWVSDQLRENGSVKRAYLGVGIQPVTQDLAKELGVTPRGGVLVVDDEKSMCDLVETALSLDGCEVVTCQSADLAFQTLHEHEFDAVLTDVRMPGTSGLDLCRQITELRPDLPVIVMTAFGSMESAITANRCWNCTTRYAASAPRMRQS